MMILTLKQVRKMNDLTIKQMAGKLSVCADTYRKIERNPDLATIGMVKKISEITGISYDVIFFGKESSLNGLSSHTS